MWCFINIHFNQNVNSAEKSTTKVRGTSLLLCYYCVTTCCLYIKCIKVSYIKNEKSRISIFRSSFVVVVVVGFTKISIYFPLSLDNRGAVETDSSVWKQKLKLWQVHENIIWWLITVTVAFSHWLFKSGWTCIVSLWRILHQTSIILERKLNSRKD